VQPPAEVQGKGLQTVQDLRAPAGIYAEVRDLSNLFPAIGPGRPVARCHEGELV